MAARGQNQGKGDNKLAYDPKPKIPPPPKREDPAKDSICHECGVLRANLSGNGSEFLKCVGDREVEGGMIKVLRRELSIEGCDVVCDLHWTTVKNILKYLMNTKDMFLVYEGDTEQKLKVSCYTDVGYLTDTDDLKSQTRYVFVLNGGVVDWKSAKQSISLLISKAEYITAYYASKEVHLV
ncbi:hypothetical protein Tco_0695485 [Tanacetum coccineum]